MDGPLIKSFGVSNPDFVHLRVVIHNTLPNDTKFGCSVSKNLDSAFLEHLRSFPAFLNIIFGIFGNFRIDIYIFDCLKQNKNDFSNFQKSKSMT